MTKQKSKRSFINRLKVAPVMVVAVLLVVGGSVGVVHASIQSQINEQKAEKARNESKLDGLVDQASSYQDAINKLQGQISNVENAIANNQAKQAKIQDEINAAQKKLNQQKSFLRSDIKSMYVNGQMSTIEMLATSKNLSSFVDAETYRGAVQSKIQDTLDQIAKLQNQLSNQKQSVLSLIATEKSQRNQIADAKAKQNQLLSLNEGQQVIYTKKIKANSARIAKLQAEQIAQNRARFGGGVVYGGTGSYPYANATCMNPSGDCSASATFTDGNGGPYNWGVNGNPWDELNWQVRNCTSYAFWKLAVSKHIYLDASQFPNTYANGGGIGYSIPDFQALARQGVIKSIDHNPSGATLVIEGAGDYGPGNYGHIMYDEGSYVSQYNVYGDGRYSTMPVPTGWGYWYVHL